MQCMHSADSQSLTFRYDCILETFFFFLFVVYIRFVCAICFSFASRNRLYVLWIFHRACKIPSAKWCIWVKERKSKESASHVLVHVNTFFNELLCIFKHFYSVSASIHVSDIQTHDATDVQWVLSLRSANYYYYYFP